MKLLHVLSASAVVAGLSVPLLAGAASATESCHTSKVAVTKVEKVKVTSLVKGKKVTKLKSEKVVVHVLEKVREKVGGKWTMVTKSVVKYKSVQTCVTTDPPPVTVLSASVAQTFTVSPTNPLVTTFTYTAAAIETVTTNGVAVQTNLGLQGTLPSGTLSLTADGVPECSISVGGATAGGPCTVTFAATGNHAVVATYTSGATSTSGAVTAVVTPFSTATYVGGNYNSTGASSGVWTGEVSVGDENGNVLSPAAGQVTISLLDNGTTLGTWTTSSAVTACTWTVSLGVTTDTFTNSGSCTGPASVSVPNTDLLNNDFTMIGAYAGTAGYTGSQSTPYIV